MNPTQVKSTPNLSALNHSENVQNIIQAKAEVANDFKSLLAEGEELLTAVAGVSDHAIHLARDRFSAQLKVARNRLAEMQAATTAQAKQAARATNKYVQANPWKSVAVAGGVGLLLGRFLLGRRK